MFVCQKPVSYKHSLNCLERKRKTVEHFVAHEKNTRAMGWGKKIRVMKDIIKIKR